MGPVDKPSRAKNKNDFFRRNIKTQADLCGFTSFFVKYTGIKRLCFWRGVFINWPKWS